MKRVIFLIEANKGEKALKASFDKLMSETVGEDSEASKCFKKQSEEMWLRVLGTIKE